MTDDEADEYVAVIGPVLGEVDHMIEEMIGRGIPERIVCSALIMCAVHMAADRQFASPAALTKLFMGMLEHHGAAAMVQFQ